MTTRPAQSAGFRTTLPPVLFLSFVLFISITPRLLLAPLLLRIADSLGVAFDVASGFFLTVSVGFVAGLLASGYVASRLSHRWTIVGSVGGSGAALAAASFAGSVPVFHLLLCLLGFCGGLYPGSGVASVVALAAPEHRGKALAIHESGPNLAFLLAPVVAALLAPRIGWRGVCLVAGLCTVGCAAAFAVRGQASDEPARPLSVASLSVFARSRSFWVVSVLFMVAAAGAMGVFAVLPTYLMVDHGLPERTVNTLVGLSRVTGFGSILVAGALVDRLGFRRVVALVLAVTGAVTVGLGLLTGGALLVAVFLQPMLIGAFFPVGMSALTTASPPHARNLAVALAIPLANLVGSGFAPRLLSAAGAAGRFGAGFVVLGLITMASVLLLSVMPADDRGRRHRQPATDLPGG